MFAVLLLFALGAHAHGGSSASTNSSMGGMMAALHFTPLGDTIWFAGWAPQSSGALAGACIGLFLLGVFERWVAARRTMLQAQWALRVRRASPNTKSWVQAPPFIPAHDVPRGALYALQVVLGYAIMLAVMMFQVAYIISIVAGLGVGEMLFGRYAGSVSGAH
ncbi:Ctr copper transporter family-domain-containing protein [Mycena sp. CBHHK59/15]|nr:Ctr copper transporter family-domain-containing protein [Mycena sp. CBHHK59/15]